MLFHKKVVGCNAVIIRNLINEMIECIKCWHELQEEEVYEFLLILNELIANGIIHGNNGKCDKALTAIIQELNSNTINICICDEGNGFDYNTIMQNDVDSTDIFTESGRGLKIIKALCDTIKFDCNSNNGNKISISKSIKR